MSVIGEGRWVASERCNKMTFILVNSLQVRHRDFAKAKTSQNEILLIIECLLYGRHSVTQAPLLVSVISQRVVGWGMLLELLTWDRHHSKHLISANTFNLQTHLITMKYVLLLFLTNSEVMEVMRSSRLAQGLHLVIWIYIIRSLPGAHVNSVMNHLMILVSYVLICLPSQSWSASLLGPLSFLSFFTIYLFILFHCFWLRWAFVAAHGLSLIVASEGYS